MRNRLYRVKFFYKTGSSSDKEVSTSTIIEVTSEGKHSTAGHVLDELDTLGLHDEHRGAVLSRIEIVALHSQTHEELT